MNIDYKSYEYFFKYTSVSDLLKNVIQNNEQKDAKDFLAKKKTFSTHSYLIGAKEKIESHGSVLRDHILTSFSVSTAPYQESI